MYLSYCELIYLLFHYFYRVSAIIKHAANLVSATKHVKIGAVALRTAKEIKEIHEKRFGNQNYVEDDSSESDEDDEQEAPPPKIMKLSPPIPEYINYENQPNPEQAVSMSDGDDDDDDDDDDGNEDNDQRKIPHEPLIDIIVEDDNDLEEEEVETEVETGTKDKKK